MLALGDESPVRVRGADRRVDPEPARQFDEQLDVLIVTPIVGKLLLDLGSDSDSLASNRDLSRFCTSLRLLRYRTMPCSQFVPAISSWLTASARAGRGKSP